MHVSYKGILAIAFGLVGLAGIGYGIYSDKQKKSVKSKPNDATEIIRKAAHETSGQADVAIVDAVNASRINQLLQKLAVIDRNKSGADEEIRMLKVEVQKLLTSNRGGVNGIHGFIGETSQVHISNIKAFINGEEPLYILLDDRVAIIYEQKSVKFTGKSQKILSCFLLLTAFLYNIKI